MLTRGWMIVYPRLRVPRGRIDLHPVQRMRDGFDQPPRRVRRQLRVGIERDDVRNRQRQVAGDQDLFVALAAQKRVQFFQFSALALAADPALLAFRPDPRPVKQQEAVARTPVFGNG